MRTTWTRVVPACAALALLAGIPAASAQELTPGQVVTGAAADDDPAIFTFRANSAGVLTVVVRSVGEVDLVLTATDAAGQPLPDGRSDQDLGGDQGAEQVSVVLPRPGTYRVQVEPWGFSSSGGEFRIGASWLPFPELELPPDPDGSPETATRLAPEQQSRDESLDTSMGDNWDWFAVTATQSGTITVLTRSDEGDLVLEAYEEGTYDEPFERSDQDLQGSSGSEALTLSIDAGQTFYFKVRPFSERGGQIGYRLQLGFIPN